jgi:peptidoglycan/xylan/chitin deacetylase (PgdA/CDA1 family)
MLLMQTACRSVPPAVPPAADAPQILFLLAFDDGPSIREPDNPTLAIINQLATNNVQPDIKALFFVQTEHPRGGGTPRGREIMSLAYEQGHELGIHSASTKGHVSHISQTEEELTSELRQAQEVLRTVTGSEVRFVHPPFGAHNLSTRTVYEQTGLTRMTANVRACDGIIYGYNISLRRRSNICNYLKKLHAAADPEAITCAVVNFHDTNPYTARHMTEYLTILVEEAHRAGFAVPDKPFCASREQIARIVEAQRETD